MAEDQKILEKITSLSKRRGFVFPGSDLYGGLANTYDYGPLGVLLKKNLADYWWETFVTGRSDMYAVDSACLMSPRVWEASGHTRSFTNILIDCTQCQYRTRADHLIEDYLGGEENWEGKPLVELDKIIKEKKIPCPKCQAIAWTKARLFNLLFETNIGIITTGQTKAYLRGELAQGMFVNFKNVLDSCHPTLPFGLAQTGKAYRNEVTLGKFTFRTLEFDLAEFEYFVEPKSWEEHFEYWKKEMYSFARSLGIEADFLRWRPHGEKELSHYSRRTEDLEYKFPWGFKEMWGLAYRTDYDLKNHMEQSGVDLQYSDPQTQKKFIPHVVEPTFGISRLFAILMINSYWEDDKRVVLRLAPRLAPYKVAIFPLLANKPELIKIAKKVYRQLGFKFSVAWDDRGNIGKRYFAQDEIGTPWCVTIDFETIEKKTVTVRDRDTMKQERLPISKLIDYFSKKLEEK